MTRTNDRKDGGRRDGKQNGDDGFEQVLNYVRDEMEPHIDGYTRSYLRRRVDSRIRRADCEGYEDYVELLRDDADERRDLMDAFWINVTRFFRNPDVWERLYETLPDEGSLRAASVGCADGSEAYSLAVLCASKGVDVSVTGIDADPRAVEVAREGTYDADIDELETVSFVDDATEYVVEKDDCLEVDREIRRNVDFVQGNAMDVSNLFRGYDLVLCRNLLIYVRADRREPIFEGVTGMLDDGGLLVLGKTESLPSDYRQKYTTVDGRLRIYRKK